MIISPQRRGGAEKKFVCLKPLKITLPQNQEYFCKATCISHNPNIIIHKIKR